MNKLLKLPLFLAICGAACAGILAGVHAWTQPIISANADRKAKEAYYEAFAGVEGLEDTSKLLFPDREISDTLKNKGVSAKVAVEYDGQEVGMVYTCKASGGFGGDINFQIAFYKGKYFKYTDLGHSETPTYGGVVISNMNQYIDGVDASSDYTKNTDYNNFITGRSTTAKAISNVILSCAADYAGGN